MGKTFPTVVGSPEFSETVMLDLLHMDPWPLLGEV